MIRLLHAGVKHKSARFAAPVFHLWHRENDRSAAHREPLAPGRDPRVRARRSARRARPPLMSAAVACAACVYPASAPPRARRRHAAHGRRPARHAGDPFDQGCVAAGECGRARFRRDARFPHGQSRRAPGAHRAGTDRFRGASQARRDACARLRSRAFAPAGGPADDLRVDRGQTPRRTARAQRQVALETRAPQRVGAFRQSRHAHGACAPGAPRSDRRRTQRAGAGLVDAGRRAPRRARCSPRSKAGRTP